MPAFLRAANFPLDYDAIGLAYYDDTAGAFDPDYVLGGLRGSGTNNIDANPGPGAGPTLILPEDVDDLWVGFRMWTEGSSNSSHVRRIRVFDANNEVLAQTRKITNTTLRLEVYGDSMAFSSDTAWNRENAGFHDVVLHVFEDATDRTFEFYYNGALSSSATVAKGSLGPARKILLWEPWGMANLASHWFLISEVIVTDGIDPRGLRLSARRATASGAVNTMLGSHTDINDDDDTKIAVSTQAGQRLLWEPGAYGGPVGPQNIRAVMAGARASREAGEPSRLAQTLRISGVNYDSAALPVGVTTHPQAVWELNPATGNPWTAAELDQIQVGLLSDNAA